MMRPMFGMGAQVFRGKYTRSSRARLWAVLFLQAIALLMDKVPADKVVVPSKGNKNPAVLKYDPTGLRSTMSATNEEMQKSIQVNRVCMTLGETKDFDSSLELGGKMRPKSSNFFLGVPM